MQRQIYREENIMPKFRVEGIPVTIIPCRKKSRAEVITDVDNHMAWGKNIPGLPAIDRNFLLELSLAMNDMDITEAMGETLEPIN